MPTDAATLRRTAEERARVAADLILADCMDRRGIKHAFAEVEVEVMHKEILPAWKHIIATALLRERAEGMRRGAACTRTAKDQDEMWAELRAIEEAAAP